MGLIGLSVVAECPGPDTQDQTIVPGLKRLPQSIFHNLSLQDNIIIQPPARNAIPVPASFLSESGAMLLLGAHWLAGAI